MANDRNEMDRRGFIRRGGQAVVAGVAATLLARPAAAKDASQTLSSTTTGRCGTCKFWGGVRKISKDGSTVAFQGEPAKGWCNNPESPNYHKQTTPDQGPMPLWRKWGALS